MSADVDKWQLPIGQILAGKLEASHWLRGQEMELWNVLELGELLYKKGSWGDFTEHCLLVSTGNGI